MNKKLFICRLMFAASFVFVFLTVAAMYFYPGGTYTNPQTTGYSFTMNFFSDLGITKTYSGVSNYISMVMFIISMAGVGIALIFFGRNGVMFFSIKSRGKAVLTISKIVAGAAGILFIGIALTPADKVLNMHIFFVKSAFSMLLLYILLITVLQTINRWDKMYVYINYLYFLILCIYLYILFNGPDFNTPSGLMFNVVSQKIIVYVSIVNIGIQAAGQIRYIKRQAIKQE
jgi:hypothetical protein